MARPRKNPQTGQSGEGAQTTGSSGAARHRSRRMTLQTRVTALVQSQNKRLITLADQIKQIARGG